MKKTNKRPTQVKRILKYLEDFGSITTLEALQDLGVMRLGARICEIRQIGIIVNDKFEVVKNRYGEKCHIKRYFLKEV